MHAGGVSFPGQKIAGIAGVLSSMSLHLYKLHIARTGEQRLALCRGHRI